MPATVHRITLEPYITKTFPTTVDPNNVIEKFYVDPCYPVTRVIDNPRESESRFL